MQTLLPLHYDAVSAMALWDNTLCSACGVTIKLWSMDNSRIKQVRTHIFIAYTSYSASEFVQDMLYIQYICTYICTHVRTYVCKVYICTYVEVGAVSIVSVTT